MKKKIISLLLASAIILSAFSGCNNSEGNTPETTTPAEPVPTASEESTAPESTEAQTEPAAETTEGEQGGSTSEDGTVNKIADAIKAAYGENYLPDMPMEGELIQQVFGLEPDLYTEIFAETPMIGAHPDTLLIAKAAEGKVEDVKSKLDAYRERLVNDTMQYPMNLPKINASQVVVNGDYVAFILLGAFSEDEDASEEEQAKFAEEQEQIGIDAFNKYFE